MVVGLDIIHAAPEIERALESLHHVLIPGGCLLVVELDGRDWQYKPGTLWTDTVFGAFSEWFGYADGRHHPSVSLDGCEHRAGSVGFVDFQHVAQIEGGLDFLFIAQKSTIVESSFDLTIPTHHEFTYMFSKEMELHEEIKNFSVDTEISFWIPAASGTDGDATQGLVKSLSRKYSSWNVHLGILESGSNELSRVGWM